MGGFVSKAIDGLRKLTRNMLPVGSTAIASSGASGYIREPYMGAWQQNQSLNTRDGMLASSAVFACVDLISSDVAKLRTKYVKLVDGVWIESTAPRFTGVLKKPNPYQTRFQFFKTWIGSKLTHGNAFILLTRNSMGVVIQMDVLNPKYVIPLVAPDGSVFYQITMSPLQVSPLEAWVVPARDMIHDRGMTSWHPLIGMTPIAACAASATLSNAIATNSASFFSNAARPSVFMSAPAAISQDTAARLKESVEGGYSGANTGRVMVGGDGLTLTHMTMSGADAQTIEQLQWTAQDVARCFHVPGHKIGLDSGSRTANSSAIYESMYYSDCLQAYLEAIELLLDSGFNLPDDSAIQFDTTGLMRMDESAMHASLATAVGAGYMKINEARARTGLGPVTGGDTPYLQQQNYSLQALAKRDSSADPFATTQPAGGADSDPEGDGTADDTPTDNGEATQ